MNILVTGGAGYVGSHVVYGLIEKGYHVTVFDNLSTGNKEAVHHKAKFFEGSQLNIKDLEEVFSSTKFDLVIHLSAKLIVSESVKYPEIYEKNNVGGMKNILDVMKKYKVNNIIFSSTGSIYGNASESPISEDAIKKPINPYAKTKLECEKLIINSNLNYVIFRYFNVAGAHPNGHIGQSTKGHKVTHLIPSIIETSYGKRDIFKIFGDTYPTNDGTCIRDYVHVMDLVDAHLLAIKFLERKKSDIFNLGTGIGSSVKEVIAEAEKNGYVIPTKIIDAKKGDPAELVASTKKAEEFLNFKAKRDLCEMVVSEYRWQGNKKF